MESDPIGLDGGLNTYSYVRSNPNRFVDIHGLDIALQWHKVQRPFPIYHTSLRITPCDQSTWAEDPRFELTDGDGLHYVTLGAGPDGLPGNLINELNRTKDAKPHDNQILLWDPEYDGCSCKDENEQISKLLALHEAYNSPLNYDFFPESTGHNNSNSYISGLLDAAGIYKIRAPVSTPGWDTPLPANRFGQ